MPPKRPSSATETPHAKVTKTEHFTPDDFSNSVKKRLQSSTRTGQACDRCKVRKIRCDGLPGGCSACLHNNTECRTTDRITGRATSRGYVESLEERLRDNDARIRELEDRLIAMGVEVKPADGYHTPNDAPTLDWSQAGNPNVAHIWAPALAGNPNAGLMAYAPGTPPAPETRPQETNIFRALPVFRTGCNGDNYLGVSSGNSSLSSIRGTALSVLGMEIDIADFTSNDMDEPAPSIFQPELYNKSYQSFLQSALNINTKIDKVELPAKIEGVTYVDWYFRVMNPYLPILHKPTFMTLLNRIYDDPEFRPSPAETVMVHMLFAIMFFQYAARNWEDASQQSDLNSRSNLHYHYALGFFYQLMSGHTLQDIQALTLICAHLRTFPKPGASWMATSLTMTLAIELGLHRSAKRWGQTDQQKNLLEIEMRKRIFYSVLAILVSLSGKLGRPMPLRIEDFDVELPEAVDDDLLSEAGLDTSKPGRCNFAVGVEAFKILPIFIELYSHIYAVRRSPQTYVETVRRLETKLQRWQDQLPVELTQPASSEKQEGRVFAIYLDMWALELRLLLRHPSVSLTASPEFNNENLDVCLKSARQMLHNMRQLQKYKSLDTTWYNSAVYLMAITTTLFVEWEKRDQRTAADLASLREEMNFSLDILGDVGGVLGSGKRLQEAVRVVVDGTLAMLSRNLATKTASAASAAVASADLNRPSSHSPTQGQATPPSGAPFDAQGSYSPGFPDHGDGANTAANAGARGSAYISPDDPSMTQTQTPYPAAATAQYSYPEPSYPAQPGPFDASPYPNAPDGGLNNMSSVQPSASQGSANAFMFPNAGGNPAYPPGGNFGGSQSWRQWTGTMANNLEPQEYLNSASALMQLGGRDVGQAEGGPNPAPVADMTGNMGGGDVNANGGMGAGAGQPWPLMIFDIGQGNS
ncbi:hypothetical protein L228DRAFT_245371 [Xylona heveae TC161]|uniref:Zn(2)-C6 fungal-type domain-containing protein n=1 Tax=Xylona heveae (strain CBS 132557 / TC161) TaxID=1328760 RepID=A0A165I655_XYLHT|nr:hypothetical protein L228DRAFT_245371 [Xylona heveae TC161]KZF24441.1 hypothetical protein L228DRAFT_245371 [Xylona heveae TC161]